MSNEDRYARQTRMPEIDVDGQAKLIASRVVIVGVGGLGCTLAVQLAGAGVGNLVLVDHDQVSLTNLHRQTLFREADVGANKATVAGATLKALNSDISIESVPHRLTPSNVIEVCRSADLIIDAADSFAVSYLLSDAADLHDTPLLSASVNRTFGYLGLFGVSAPSLRAVFPKLPQEQTSCESTGVTGPSVAAIASLQAQEAIKVLLGRATLAGKLLYFDVWNYTLHSIDVSGAQNPEGAVLRLIEAHELVGTDYVVDVRSQEETHSSPHSFKVHQCLPINDLLAEECVFPDTRIVFVCRSGQRAMVAAQALLERGTHTVAAILPSR